MSSAAQQSRQRPSRKGTTAKTERPRLHVIDHGKLKREARRRGVVMGVIVLLAGCLFVIAFVHATLVQDQQRLDQVKTDIALAEERSAQLERDVMVASAPVAIVERAEALGMVRAQHPEYLVAVHYVAGHSIRGPVVESETQQDELSDTGETSE